MGKGVTTDPSHQADRRAARSRTPPASRASTRRSPSKVIEELLKRGRFDVVQDATGVDALVEGELVSLQRHARRLQRGRARGAAASTQASRYAITLTARVRYAKVGRRRSRSGPNDSFSFRDEYDVGADPATFFDREEQAIERLASAFARNLVAAMLEAF